MDNSVNGSDKEKLLAKMEAFAEGDFGFLSEDELEDKDLVKAFNSMVDNVMKRNNRYLARINDAQLRIGNLSTIKSIFRDLEIQQENISVLSESSGDLDIFEEINEERNREFLMLSLQIDKTIKASMIEISNSIKRIEEANEDEREIRAKELLPSAKGVLTLLEGSLTRLDDLCEDAKAIFNESEKRDRITSAFLNNANNIKKSYHELNNACFELGKYLYRISRDVDNARNDMFRHNAKPTLHDRLRVFEVDHLTLGWRLYNNIVEFENLKITQINNPNGCKFGLWVQSVDNPEIVNSNAFEACVQAHILFHEKAVECFEAKQGFDEADAYIKFDEVINRLDVFLKCMEELHVHLRSIGITDETDVWKFRG